MAKPIDSSNKKIAILIPAYNEEKYIHKVIKNCLKYKLDIIVINDGCTDNTSKIVKSIPEPDNCRIMLLEHAHNLGKGQALKTGFRYIINNSYKGVITIDADGQHSTNEIINFLNAVEKDDPDIIVGSRFQNTKNMPFDRVFANTSSSWIISLIAGKKIEDVQSGFRYISSRALKNIKLETNNFDTESEILLKASWKGYKIKNIPISTIYHKNFTSYFHPIKDTIKFFQLIFKSLLWKIDYRRKAPLKKA